MGWSHLSVGGPIRFPIRKIILAEQILELEHLATKRFRILLRGKEKRAAKERFSLVAGVRLYPSHVKEQAFPPESWERSVSATVRKHKMQLVKRRITK